MKNLGFSKQIIIFFQILAISLFLVLLYQNGKVYREIEFIKQKTNELKDTRIALMALKQKISRFHKIKEKLIKCKKDFINYSWQDIELFFEPISFKELIIRFNNLDNQISRLYGKKGKFILDRFKTVRVSANSTQEGDEFKDIQKLILKQPSFEIKGRLFSLCP